MAKKTMFSEDYLFRGQHQVMVNTLSKVVVDKDSDSKLFSSAVELFIFASLVGALKRRKSEPYKDNTTFRIMSSQFFNHRNELNLAFKFVIFASEIDNVDPVERLNRAFRNPETDDNYTLFEKYMLGGLEDLYETLIVDSNVNFEDYLTSINVLLDSYKNLDEEIIEDIDTSDFDF